MSKRVQPSQDYANQFEEMLGERMRSTLRLDSVDGLPESWSALINEIESRIDPARADDHGQRTDTAPAAASRDTLWALNS